MRFGFPFRERARYTPPPTPDAPCAARFLIWDRTQTGETLTSGLRTLNAATGALSDTDVAAGTPLSYDVLRARAVNGGTFGLFVDSAIPGFMRGERWNDDPSMLWRFNGDEETPKLQLYAGGASAAGDTFLLAGNASASSWAADPELILREYDDAGSVTNEVSISAAWLPSGLEFNLIAPSLTVSPGGEVAVAALMLYDNSDFEYHAYIIGIDTSTGDVAWTEEVGGDLAAFLGGGTTRSGNSLYYAATWVDIYPHTSGDWYPVLVRYDFTGGWNSSPSETWRENPSVYANTALGGNLQATATRVFAVAYETGESTAPTLVAFKPDGSIAWSEQVGESDSIGASFAAGADTVVMPEVVTVDETPVWQYRVFAAEDGTEADFSPVGTATSHYGVIGIINASPCVEAGACYHRVAAAVNDDTWGVLGLREPHLPAAWEAAVSDRPHRLVETAWHDVVTDTRAGVLHVPSVGTTVRHFASYGAELWAWEAPARPYDAAFHYNHQLAIVPVMNGSLVDVWQVSLAGAASVRFTIDPSDASLPAGTVIACEVNTQGYAYLLHQAAGTNVATLIAVDWDDGSITWTLQVGDGASNASELLSVSRGATNNDLFTTAVENDGTYDQVVVKRWWFDGGVLYEAPDPVWATTVTDGGLHHDVTAFHTRWNDVWVAYTVNAADDAHVVTSIARLAGTVQWTYGPASAVGSPRGVGLSASLDGLRLIAAVEDEVGGDATPRLVVLDLLDGGALLDAVEFGEVGPLALVLCPVIFPSS